MMKVYNLKTNLTDKQNKELLKSLSDDDVKFLSELEMVASVDLLDEDDLLNTVMVINTLNLEKLKVYLKKAEIIYELEDITSEFTEETDLDKVKEELEQLTTEDILKKFGIEV